MQLKKLLRKLSETRKKTPQLQCNILYTILQQVSQLFSTISDVLHSGQFIRSLVVFKDHLDYLVFLDCAVSVSFLQGLTMVFLNVQHLSIGMFAYFMLHPHNQIAYTGFIESK